MANVDIGYNKASNKVIHYVYRDFFSVTFFFSFSYILFTFFFSSFFFFFFGKWSSHLNVQ